MDFKDKLAVITGGASGIGRSVALAMAKLGTDIVLADNDYVRLIEVGKEIENIGRHILTIQCDVSNNEDIDNLVRQTISTFGTPDIIMNNAGVSVYGNFEKVGIAEYEKTFSINVLGVIRGVLAFLPYMLERGRGYIINTASRAGFYGSADPYWLSKYTIIGYSEGLFCHLRSKGIMVSVLCPGIVTTNLRFNSTIIGDRQETIDTKLQLEDLYTRPDSLKPDDVATMVINGIKENKFLIITPNTEDYLTEAKNRGRDYQILENYLQNTMDKNSDQ